MSKRYEVRMEFTVTESGFMDIYVSADSEEEARKIAAARAEEFTDGSVDMYGGDVESITVDDDHIDWIVEEVDLNVSKLVKGK
jgi:hypothetical protein